MGHSVHNLLTPSVHNLMTLNVHEVLTLYTGYSLRRYHFSLLNILCPFLVEQTPWPTN